MLLHRPNDIPGLGQEVPVKEVGAIRAPRRVVTLTVVAGNIGVEREEVIRAPQGQQHLTGTLSDSLLGDNQVATAQHRRTHQEPAHGVGAVAVKDLIDIRIVAQRLRHLLAVVTKHDAVANHVLECRAVKECGGQHMERIEPATRLSDVLHDVVGRVVRIKPVAILERIVHLSERHRPRVEPHVEHIRDTAHGGLTGRVVWIRSRQLVNLGPVQIGGTNPEVALELVERTVDIDARVFRVVALPDGNGRTPEAIAADGPVAGTFEPLAELTVLDVVGHPVDLLVEFDHAVAELGDAHEPRRNGPIDQRITTTPAVRVRVLVAGHANQSAHVAQHGREGLVGVEDLLAGDLGNAREEDTTVVQRHHDGDTVFLAHLLVILAIGGC